MSGFFITFEGIEGSGKSTQANRLAKHLNTLNMPTIISKEPGGTELCKDIRHTILKQHNTNETWTPMAELMLFYADRSQHLNQLIIPMLKMDKIVISDRFDDSTKAYQGARGISDEIINNLSHLIVNTCFPDITILLDIEPSISINRTITRNQENNNITETRFDNENIAFHQLVRQRFLNIAVQNPKRIIVIQAQNDPDTIENTIWHHTKKTLQNSGYNIS